MIPIYEQSDGNGIGHSFDSFSRRFDEICKEHLANGRARAFAFIFYDFTNSDLRDILKNDGVFAKLDRLSGTKLSIFYLHSGSRTSIKKFNQHFITALGITDQVELPCVVFFKVQNEKIEDIEIAQLDSSNLIHGFHELYTAVQRYLVAEPNVPNPESRALKRLKGGSKFVSLELFRAVLKRGFESFF